MPTTHVDEIQIEAMFFSISVILSNSNAISFLNLALLESIFCIESSEKTPCDILRSMKRRFIISVLRGARGWWHAPNDARILNYIELR